MATVRAATTHANGKRGMTWVGSATPTKAAMADGGLARDSGCKVMTPCPAYLSIFKGAAGGAVRADKAGHLLPFKVILPRQRRIVSTCTGQPLPAPFRPAPSFNTCLI